MERSQGNNYKGKSIVVHGLPPRYPKTAINNNGDSSNHLPLPFSMSPSTLPLAPDSYQIWKRPSTTSFDIPGASSSYSDSTLADNPDYPTLDSNSYSNRNNVAAADLDFPAFVTNELDFTSLPNIFDNIGGGDDDKGKSLIFGDVGDDTVKTDGVGGAVKSCFGHRKTTNVEEKRIKRILSNRLSAERSRMRRIERMGYLEKKAKFLQDHITVLRPQVSLKRKHVQSLKIENKNLHQRMIASTNENIMKDAETEVNKNKIRELRQHHHSQYQRKLMQEQLMMPVWEARLKGMMNPSLNRSGWTEQMVYPNWANPTRGQCGVMNTGDHQMNLLNQLLMMNQPADNYQNRSDHQHENIAGFPKVGADDDDDHQLLGINNNPGVNMAPVLLRPQSAGDREPLLGLHQQVNHYDPLDGVENYLDHMDENAAPEQEDRDPVDLSDVDLFLNLPDNIEQFPPNDRSM